MRTHVSTGCAGSLPKRQPIFGEYPAFDAGAYTFLADYLPWAVGDGMEHRNSSVLTNSASLAGSPRFLLDTAAHEFFHAWNVERIRPRTLEPFDLEAANMSGELWLAEGVTTYYEKLVLQRTGLATLNETLHDWSAVVNEVLGSPALRFRWGEQISRMAPLVDGGGALNPTNWNYSYLSYYVHGAGLGLALDLGLREHTDGHRSLDDFMRAMWTHHGRPGGTPVGTVAAPSRSTMCGHGSRKWRAIRRSATRSSRASCRDARRTFSDYAHLLALAGLRLRKAAPGRASMGPLPLSRAGPVFASRLRSYPARRSMRPGRRKTTRFSRLTAATSQAWTCSNARFNGTHQARASPCASCHEGRPPHAPWTSRWSISHGWRSCRSSRSGRR